MPSRGFTHAKALNGRQLVIRADANSQTGVGHVMRCLALASGWIEAGGKVTFLTRLENEAIARRIEASGASMISLSQSHPHESDLIASLATLQRLTFGLPGDAHSPCLVLDGYHFDADYQSAVRLAGYRLLCLDDHAHLPCYHCDWLLNQNLGSSQLGYETDPDTVSLLGPRFVLLRSEFRNWQNWQRGFSSPTANVLVTLGGSDPDNLSLRILNALGQVAVRDLHTRVVVGPASRHLAVLRQAAQTNHAKLEILTDVMDMPGLMAWADVAVSAGGSTCWELAFMGLPNLIVILAKNQQGIAEGLAEAGASLNLGWHAEIAATDVAQALNALLASRPRQEKMSRLARAIVDGNGIHRVLAALCSARQPAACP